MGFFPYKFYSKYLILYTGIFYFVRWMEIHLD